MMISSGTTEQKIKQDYHLTAESEDEAISAIASYLSRKYGDKITDPNIDVHAVVFPMSPVLLHGL